ncbi:MAG TPA: hypothetical protein VF461_07245 [Gemmatimonadaceae bacterium]
MSRRPGSSPWRLLLAWVIVLAFSREANAQRFVGSVTDVRPAGERAGCSDPRRVSTTLTAVTVERGRSTQPLEPPLPRRLALGDGFIVSKGSDTRLRIDDATYGHGAIVLAPQLLCGLWAADTTIAPSKGGDGRYSLDSVGGTKATRGLRLTIESGGAFVQWDSALKYRLHILGGTAMTITGTQLVVVTDASGSRGYLYVRAGSVAFDAYPAIRATTGQLYRLARGAAPQRVPLSAAANDAAATDVDYHERLVWQATQPPPPPTPTTRIPTTPPPQSTMRRLLRNPLTYVALGGAGYGVWRVTRSDSPSGNTSSSTSNNTSTGQVGISFPL